MLASLPTCPDAISVRGLAEDLDCPHHIVDHYIRTLRLRVIRIRDRHHKHLSCLSPEDAALITKAYQAAESAARAAATSHPLPLPHPQTPAPNTDHTTPKTAPNLTLTPTHTLTLPRIDTGWGYFYLIQLEPTHDPGRYKLGFSNNPKDRLSTFLTAAPHAVILGQWPAHRTWERTAIASVTQGSDCVRHEVFRTNDLAAVRAAADRLFALLPKTPLSTNTPPPDPSPLNSRIQPLRNPDAADNQKTVVFPPSFAPSRTASAALLSSCLLAFADPAAQAAPGPREAIDTYCLSCHDAETKKGKLDLETILDAPIAQHATVWEKVVRQLDARQMPPPGKDRPDEAGFRQLATSLTSELDRQSAEHPQPGRTDTLRRMTRTEYQNAIRDLLALEADASALLPPDESSHGFDNVTVGDLSPALLQRYIIAAEKISRLAVGAVSPQPDAEAIRVKPDVTQEDHIEGLPLGTRGGALIRHTFPQEGEYEVQVLLMRDRNEAVEGLNGEHEMEVLLDRECLASFTVKPGGKDQSKVDAHLKARIHVPAGPHDLGVTFIKNPSSVLERLRQPYKASFNFHRHPRLSPAVYQVSIIGPSDARGPGATPSRQRLFITYPKAESEEDACAKQILSTLARRAFRRPVTDSDLERPLAFYRDARGRGDSFDAGIEAALSAVLVSREFLFRTERDPAWLPPKTPYRISDLELASRLSFFLWSSLPDDALLDAAVRGDLEKPELLEREVRRLLADPRAQALATNFAEQWLYLRNLDSITPDGRLFPDFDDNLRQAFRAETTLLFREIMQEDRSVLDLIRSDHAWLNERLAQHYGIPHVYGERFRRVQLAPEDHRGGLLRQGTILTVTSYATRTSPVIRGHWILQNLLGTTPPPQPPNVPALQENVIAASLPMRERLAQHRTNAACASCHNVMDPVGFALENYDAIGRWRDQEEGRPVDASGGMPDGSKFTGIEGVERGLLSRPEPFVGTLTEKLLTYALGRGIEPFDAPAVREIVRRAARKDYRFSEIIVSIAASTPFQMRATP